MSSPIKPMTIGFSTCPNDTFIFYALMKKKIPWRDLHFSETLADVETLNQMAFNKQLDVTKLSFQVFGHLLDDYVLLRSGSALGRGCGPLLVAKQSYSTGQLIKKRIAIPGKNTTATMLLRLYNNRFENLVEMTFDKIIPAVKEGTVDAGVIIHEGRFTYQRENLVKIVDLGNWWEDISGLPIPLGGIFARRDLDRSIISDLGSCLKKSVNYALQHPDEPMEYIKEYAQELEDDVIKQHLKLYVNSFTADLGEEGIAAIQYLLRIGYKKGLFQTYRDDFLA